MFLDLVEEIVPASDQTTLVLVVDHLQLVSLPHLTHLTTSRLSVCHNVLYLAYTNMYFFLTFYNMHFYNVNISRKSKCVEML